MFISLKKKKLAMFKDDFKRNSSRRLGCLLTLIFRLAVIVTIVTAILYFVALLLWPLLYIVLVIVTLGAMLLTDAPLDASSFLNRLTPVITVALIVCVIAFALRFAIDWLLILSESRSLKKDPTANASYINIARVVKKVKLLDLAVFAAMIISVAGIVFFAQSGIDGGTLDTLNKALPVILFIIFILSPIAGKIASHILFSSVASDIAKVYKK